MLLLLRNLKLVKAQNKVLSSLIKNNSFSTTKSVKNVIQLHNERLMKNTLLNEIKSSLEDDGGTFLVNDPSTQSPLAKVKEMGKKEGEDKIRESYDLFHSPSWKELGIKQRHDKLRQLYDLMIKNEKELATIITLENGKTFNESIGEVRYAASFIEWFSEQTLRIDGSVINSENKDSKYLVVKEPVGVVGIITPWNFPLAMITRKFGAAFAAGCTTVIKPASETPLTCLAFANLLKKVEIPEASFSVITTHESTKEIGKLLCQSDLISKISFTGSTMVGKLLLRDSSDTVKKVSMELGGNAPFIVMENSDIGKAVQCLVQGKFRNSGQTCVCPNRVYIQDTIYDAFLNKLTKKVEELKVGNGFKEGVTVGPLINEKSIIKIEKLVKNSIELGAKIVCGGNRVNDNDVEGYFYQPTIIKDANPKMDISCNEIFGPVLVCYKFSSLKEAIELANDSEYGLAAYAFTNDLKEAFELANKIQSGMVAINAGSVSSTLAPFGGVKHSGFGREGSKYGLDDYLNIKTVNLNY
ncbi:aldehyde dehydrogenase [Neoconidiobolus thromboides FSU 785]|nr:aldehyde dehydrogenase [Neoconidiobolus thromboides FSU 785]